MSLVQVNAPPALECSLEQPSTARHPDGSNEAQPFTTPDQDIEETLRRQSGELPSNELPAAATAAPTSPSAAAGDAHCFSRSSASSSSSKCEPSCDVAPVSEGVESILRSYLTSWGQRLVQLQPKVHMSEHLIECGLTLFKYLRQLQTQACCEGRFPMQYLSNEQLLIHDLVACWWLALKHCSIRTAVPNRTLMCRATSSSPELLADRELAALIAIDWEVQAVLKQGGLVL